MTRGPIREAHKGRSGWGAARLGLRGKLTGYEALDAQAILRHIDTRLIYHEIVNPLRPAEHRRMTERQDPKNSKTDIS